MTADALRVFLAWCSVINIGVLIFWLLWFQLAHDFVYRVHGQGFTLSAERFDALHYSGMLFYKVCIFLFNIVPYLVLRLVI